MMNNNLKRQSEGQENEDKELWLNAKTKKYQEQQVKPRIKDEG